VVFNKDDKVLIKVLHQKKIRSEKVYQNVSEQKLVSVVVDLVADAD